MSLFPAVMTIGVPLYGWSIIRDSPFDIPLSM
jgi:hypothetical protein